MNVGHSISPKFLNEKHLKQVIQDCLKIEAEFDSKSWQARSARSRRIAHEKRLASVQ